MNIQMHCLSKNFYFSDDLLYNFHCCLQTKPFTILYGPSGTGKSKIAELYADYICSERGLDLKKHLCFVPVRPNWTSPSDLMGFYDYLNDAFIPSGFYNFMKDAEKNKDKPYFIILDEMNLSVVEHYFSDFLACLESRRMNGKLRANLSNWQSQVTTRTHTTLSQASILAFYDLVGKGELNFNDSFDLKVLRDHEIVRQWRVHYFLGKEASWTPQFRTEFNQKDGAGENTRLAGKFFENVSSGVYKFNQQQRYILSDLSADIVDAMHKYEYSIDQHSIEIYKSKDTVELMPIPLNLYVIGTINMDESTHPLSNKVLDRANTIEVNHVSRDILSAQSVQSGSLKVDNIDSSFSGVTSLPTLNSAKILNITHPELVTLLYDINDGLTPYRANMGHRSIFEITHYINNYIDISADADLAIEALDLQLCQKLIPKLMGADERVEKSILHTASTITNGVIYNEDLLSTSDMSTFNYPKTLDKLQRMYKYYTQTGFVNFANV